MEVVAKLIKKYRKDTKRNEYALVEHDEDENEWIDVEVRDFSVQHHPTKCESSLDPYIAVLVDHPKLTSFN